MNKKEEKEAAEHLYLLSWHDALERMDILFSEIRNLQTNIIYVLKQTELYKPLRYEEKYLWHMDSNNGEKANEKDTENSIRKSQSILDDAELANDWIILYPEPANAVNQMIGNSAVTNQENQANSTKDKIDHRLNQKIAGIWTSSAWGRTQRRYYHQLRGLQILKQQLICDRITLSRHALGCSFSDPEAKDFSSDKSSIFLVLRKGILYRLAQYIARFRNHQQQFGKSFDSSFQDHPRPYVERRRDMAMYMDFLSDRCRDIRDQMNMFLNFIRPDVDSVEENKLILHGWVHSPQAETHVLYDTVFQGNNEIDYVSTHFFTPDRPDLQPSIAHEVAHGILRRQYHNLKGMLENQDSFSYLLLRMRSLMSGAMQNLNLPHYQEQIDDRLLEIACDLLAACVKGPSYLYALFLETIGGHCERLLKGSDPIRGEILDLNLIDDLGFTKNIGLHTVAREADWYYRLHLVACLVKEANHIQHGKPERILIDGVKRVCDDLLDLVMPAESSSQGRLWRDIKEDLRKLMLDSAWIMQARKWRCKRSQDDYDEIKAAKGPREMPRSARRLDKKVRELIFSEQLCMKTKPGKKLSHLVDWNEETKVVKPKKGVDLYKEFKTAYLGPIKEPGEYFCPYPIHRHLYDIPYLCALMRTQDLRSLKKPGPSVYSELQKDMALGRGLYQHALEFFIRDSESAHHRLMRIIPLVVEAVGSGETTDPVKEKLKDWLYGKKKRTDLKSIKANINGLRENFITTKRRSIQNKIFPKKNDTSWVDDYGAVAIGCLLFNTNETAKMRLNEYEKLRRKLEKLAGHTLEFLYEGISSLEIDDTEKKYLAPLHCYLGLRHNPKEAEEKSKDRFYRLISDAIGDSRVDSNFPDKNLMLKEIPVYLISRLSLLNPSMYRSALPESKSSLPKSEYEAITIKELSKGCKTKELEDKPYSSAILPLIGRYDALTITKTIPPCFCPLPFFHEVLVKDEKNSETTWENNIDAERFPVFFGQREAAIALNLYVPKKGNCNQKKAELKPGKKYFAYVSATLSHRSFRLDLIYRLLLEQEKSRNKGQGEPEKKNNTSLLEDFACRLISGDFAFLTDSWEDVIFAFAIGNEHDNEEDNIYERLDFVFDFQQALYEDFMVDRTEIMFSPKCINAVHKKDNGNKYTIYHRLRANADRHLLRSNQKLIEAYNENTQKLVEEKIIDRFDLYKTPGRMDYTLKIDSATGAVTGESFMDQLLDLDTNKGDYPLIDIPETCLKKNLSKNKS